MRLKSNEIQTIKESVLQYFGEDANVYLFGSRSNKQLKGGDIDLYIETKVTENLFGRKLQILKDLHHKMGQQKIDIVINNFTDSLFIYEVAKREGVLL